MSEYKIGQAAKLLNLSTVSLRHYEKINLVTPSFRTMTGYRMYTENDLKKLRFVINAKKAGLSLSEIKKLMDIDTRDIHGSKKVKCIIEKKMIKLDSYIQNMNYIFSYLSELNDLCDGKVKVEDCPILLSLKK